MEHEQILEYARAVFSDEIQALTSTMNILDDSFANVVKLISRNQGKVVISGIGKSGRIGEKITATLTSVGVPSCFIHATEALHGDMGIIRNDDILIAISNSGETDELLQLIHYCNKNAIIVTITGNKNSTLARHSDYVLNYSIDKEACPLNIAPTSSTTVTLVLGDALAICLMREMNFKANDFAMYHPSGSLGRRLLCRVSDEMISDNLPIVSPDSTMREIIPIMSAGRLGLVIIQNVEKLHGIFTDGDLRRLIQGSENFLDIKISTVMNHQPIIVNPDMKIVEAEELMIKRKVTSLLVINENESVIGVVQIYNAGVNSNHNKSVEVGAIL